MSYFFELLVYQKWVADVENVPSAAQNFKIYIIACVRSLLKNIGNNYLLFPSFYHSFHFISSSYDFRFSPAAEELQSGC